MIVPGGDLLAAIDAALAVLPVGTAWVQVREKDLSCRALLQLCLAVRSICVRWGAGLLVNGRMDVAQAAGAEGVHLGTRGPKVDQVRRHWPEGVIGSSCHSPGDVARSFVEGADYAILGPIFPTPSKLALGYGPLGLSALTEARTRVGTDFPLFAIGGIEPTLAPAVLEAGAHGIAIIRTILADLDPSCAAALLGAAVGLRVLATP